MTRENVLQSTQVWILCIFQLRNGQRTVQEKSEHKSTEQKRTITSTQAEQTSQPHQLISDLVVQICPLLLLFIYCWQTVKVVH